MRCVACGVEMELVRTVPDNSMIASAREFGTFECPRCHGKAQRLMSTTEIAPFATEPMQLPATSSAPLPAFMEKVSVAGQNTVVALRNAVGRVLAMIRGSRNDGR
jgi:hypothetical protein